MGCGCKTKANAAAQRKAAAAMCYTCPDFKACPVFVQVTRGTRDLRKFDHRGSVCPRNRWPDDRGIVRWWGHRWYGVPAPIWFRLAIEGAIVAFRERWRMGYLPGCGCIVPLKDLYNRIRGRVHKPEPKVIDWST